MVFVVNTIQVVNKSATTNHGQLSYKSIIFVIQYKNAFLPGAKSIKVCSFSIIPENWNCRHTSEVSLNSFPAGLYYCGNSCVISSNQIHDLITIVSCTKQFMLGKLIRMRVKRCLLMFLMHDFLHWTATFKVSSRSRLYLNI